MTKDFLKYLTVIFAYLHFSRVKSREVIKYCTFAESTLKHWVIDLKAKKYHLKLSKLQCIAMYLILSKYIMITNQEQKVSPEEVGELNVEIMQVYNLLVKKLPFYCRSQFSSLKSKRNELENVSIEEIFDRVKEKSVFKFHEFYLKHSAMGV